MGQAHSSGNWFQNAKVKDQFAAIQTLWSQEDLANLLNRLKDTTLNFSLDRVKFAKFLQLAPAYEDLVAKWFEDFACDRASKVVDGLEFLSAAIMISSKVTLFQKITLLFNLFDLDKTSCIRRDEFTIFLKALTTGLHRTVDGLPPPAPVMELGGLSAEFFATVNSQVLSQHDLLMWMTEAHYSLHYLSVLSKLHTAVFAWGANHRYQLGLNFEPKMQRVPAPVLTLENVRIASVASNESHTLYLTEEGHVWTCGSGFCGLLGHGNTNDSPQPRPVEALLHTRIIDVALGVRHSVAVSDKGQVFTWGAADLGQLGHGSTDDKEVHEFAFDPKSGGTFAYVSKPTVVMSLFGKRIAARRASCCNFSTAVLSDQGHLFTWGNNTDGQCGQGQKCPDHKLVYVDPHMQRTAMQAITVPRRVDTNVLFKKINCGGYHMLAIDEDDRVWTWGQGMWGKLGHGDQRSMYEAKLVDTLKYHVTKELAAGEAHSLCLCSLYRLTVTGNSRDVGLSPFSLLGLPVGRVDRQLAARQQTTPPNTTLQLNAFASAPLLQIGLPFRHNPDMPLFHEAGVSIEDVASSIVMLDRSLWEGEWLKLATTDIDFAVQFSPSGAQVPAKNGYSGPIMFAVEGKVEIETDCEGKICVFEVPSQTDQTPLEDITRAVVQLALQCKEGRGRACLCVLPKKVEPYAVEVPQDMPPDVLKSFVFGVMSFEHGMALRKHISRLINTRISESPDSIPDEVKGWQECTQEFTGRTYFEHAATGKKRWAPPQIHPKTEAALLIIKEDAFLPRLKAVLEVKPKGVIVCQQSWRPDVELVTLPESLLQEVHTPIVLVTYEAGEELKGVTANGAKPWVTMEIQPYGGVCAWGNGTFGQLGLAGIENQSFLTQTHNGLTNEENSFANRPYYVAHLHEHQVTNISCGSAHTIAVTQQGEVFTWGAADGLGVPLGKQSSEVPMFVEQLESLVKATKAFAGHYHSFVTAEMPYPSVIA
mmetsp:Transcript_60167/g.169740  ORF Transcript_60167/g.169740 Transcript_60167/m.169740 type:complete len:985 (-) Transcript_60167:22-2976(-)